MRVLEIIDRRRNKKKKKKKDSKGRGDIRGIRNDKTVEKENVGRFKRR